MSNVSQIESADERKERRRLHLRELAQETDSSGAAESSNTSDDETAPAQPRELVGAVLRAARVERGEDEAKVASALKMRRDQLRAIEENDFDRLPGRTYTVGFVRAYARYLGLDAEPLVQRFKDENASAEAFAKPVEHTFPEAATERSLVPNGSILIWALLIAMVIYAISYLTLPSRKSPTATAANAEEAAVIIEQPKSAREPASVQPPPATPAATVAPKASSASAVVGYVGGEKILPEAIDESSDKSAMLGDTPAVPAFKIAQLEQAAGETAVEARPAANAEPAPARPERPRVTFKALEPTYIQIKDPSQVEGRTILVSRVFNAGESYVPPNRAGLVVQTGNAGGLQVEIDGRVMGVMGKSGEVIARMPLDASYFLEHFAAAQ